MESYKTFDDLEFKPWGQMFGRNPRLSKYYENNFQAILEFENGYAISVLRGNMFYSNGIDLYEVAILKDGKVNYDNGIISDGVVGYCAVDEINEVMKKAQEL